jgi:hypothetical protein
MMGDSTMRQLWGTVYAPLQSGEFERNPNEPTKENVYRFSLYWSESN